jgi:hypothetical protein
LDYNDPLLTFLFLPLIMLDEQNGTYILRY